MANPEHLKILKQGVEVWNRWREENPEIAPDLDHMSLGGVRLDKGIVRSKDELRKAYGLASASGLSPKSAYLYGIDFRGALIRDADLSFANLHQADLDYADLEGTQFIGSILEGASLNNTSLKSTRLDLASFLGADLVSACLAGAEVGKARFEISNLENADFEGANLRGTFFCRAALDSARFLNAIMGGTTLANVDLSRAKDIETIEHLAPSTIGIDTLECSNGQISEGFLRGAGVSRRLLTYARSLMNCPIHFSSSFISYSHRDRSFAQRLHASLQARGMDCWLDENQLLPGDDIYDEVDRGIRLWDKVLLCCSEVSLTSWWVGDEIDKALEKERRFLTDRGEKILTIIPLNLDDFLFKWQDGRAATLRKRLAADFTGWEHDNSKFKEQFERVVRALRTHEGVREKHGA